MGRDPLVQRQEAFNHLREVEELIERKNRVLHQLRMQAACYPSVKLAPPHIVIQLEDIELEVRALKKKREELEQELASPVWEEMPRRELSTGGCVPAPNEREKAVGYLQLDTTDKRRISAALENAFSPHELQRLVTDHIPSVAREVPWLGIGIGQLVFQVRDTAIRHGVIDRLLVAAVEERPNRPDLLALALALAQRPGWNMPVGTHSLDIGSALEKVTSGPADPFFDTTRLARWMVAVERQVCQVRCGQAYGTGFLVAPDLVLTCHHVVARHLMDSVAKADLRVRFDYRRTITGAEPPDDDSAWIGLDPEWTIPNSHSSTADETLVGEPTADELDFALLKLGRQAGLDSASGETQPRGWIDMSQDRSLPEGGSAMFIVQHPTTGKAYPPQMPLQISLSTPGYEGVNTNGTRITYTPSTKPGSSGSPVFDRTLIAVALHHNRGEAMTNRGIPLAKIRAALGPDARALLIAPPQSL